jgi:molybdopterin-guanine dinucleotide biosynthesis protein B
MMERKRVSLLSILKTLGHYDFVFVEGFKSEPHEKIAVFRERKQAAVLKQLTAPPIAIASAFPYESEHIPVFDINDSAGLAAWIVARTQRLP